MVELMGGEMGAGVIGFEAVSSGLVQHGSNSTSRSGDGASASADRLRGGGSSEEVTHGVSTKFQVVMKQLGKKDTTTKLKVNTESLNSLSGTYVRCPRQIIIVKVTVCKSSELSFTVTSFQD